MRSGKIKYDEDGKTDTGSQYIKRRLDKESYRQGIITDISQVGGYPVYKGKPYKDADGDGMPDKWEIKYGLNPDDPDDANMGVPFRWALIAPQQHSQQLQIA